VDRVALEHPTPERVVAVLVDALLAVAALRDVAGAVVVACRLKQRRGILQHRPHGKQAAPAVLELPLHMSADLLAGRPSQCHAFSGAPISLLQKKLKRQ